MNQQRHASQLKNSQRSSWRGIPGALDTGQRYKVTYCDGTGLRRVYGYSDDLGEARKFADRIRQNRSFGRVKIVDRNVGVEPVTPATELK